MKLLLDENLSPRLVQELAKAFPESTHVELLAFRGATDRKFWEFARERGYTIVSKDSDCRQRSFLLGSPPKVSWLSVGNAGTDAIGDMLRANRERISEFIGRQEEDLLVVRMSVRPDS